MTHRFLEADVTAAARAHAMEKWPEESCGGVTADGYVPFANTHPEPRSFFSCMDEASPLIQSGALLALIHSHPHPDNPISPSAMDMAGQMAMDIPWGIVLSASDTAIAPWFWGDMLEPPPLEGRDFRHGPSGTDGRGDCGALVRDWHRLERGVLIPDFARQDNWWREGKDLYRDHFAEAGFVRRVNGGADPLPGDVVLMEIRSPVPNHAAIYAGDGYVLHHLYNRLSRVEPLIRWREHITDWLRHAP